MADEPFEDGFCLQVEKGLWIRLDRAPAVRLVGQMHQLKDRHGLIALLVLSLAVYVQFPLLALDFRHGVQNESSSQRKGGNKHERHG